MTALQRITCLRGLGDNKVSFFIGYTATLATQALWRHVVVPDHLWVPPEVKLKRPHVWTVYARTDLPKCIGPHLRMVRRGFLYAQPGSKLAAKPPPLVLLDAAPYPEAWDLFVAHARML